MRIFPRYEQSIYYTVKTTAINVIYENFGKVILVTEVNHESARVKMPSAAKLNCTGAR
jgi:hypothetical protein